MADDHDDDFMISICSFTVVLDLRETFGHSRHSTYCIPWVIDRIFEIQEVSTVVNGAIKKGFHLPATVQYVHSSTNQPTTNQHSSITILEYLLPMIVILDPWLVDQPSVAFASARLKVLIDLQYDSVLGVCIGVTDSLLA